MLLFFCGFVAVLNCNQWQFEPPVLSSCPSLTGLSRKSCNYESNLHFCSSKCFLFFLHFNERKVLVAYGLDRQEDPHSGFWFASLFVSALGVARDIGVVRRFSI